MTQKHNFIAEKITTLNLNPMAELSRKDKETARAIIDKGLQKEIEMGIVELESLIKKWREK